MHVRLLHSLTCLPPCLLPCHTYTTHKHPKKSITGGPACTAIPSNCGTSAGSPCCPMPYHIASNPPLTRYGCPKDMFCNYDDAPKPASNTTAVGITSSALPRGTCQPNTADCGQFGKKCCVFTGGSATGFRCGAQYGQPGPKGYCAGWMKAEGAATSTPLNDLVCKQCPDKVDASMEKTNPSAFFSCRTN